MNFFVGQKVVCVDARDTDIFDEVRVLCLGAVYTIRWIGVFCHPAYPAALCVRLQEIDRGFDPGAPHDETVFDLPFYASRFRPVKTTDISLFTKMLAPTPKEREPA